jgi:iron complex outermembrane receptor protein
MKFRTRFLFASSFLALLASGPAWAQAAGGSGMEQVIVTGTRGQPRTSLDSPVPVDVISAEDIQSTSFADMDNVLNKQIPSFTVTRQANTTSGTFIRPVSIRGLPEDETLLLMDGHRRHLSASSGVGGSGAEGPDAAVIPTMALSSIQVLRDGAAAQYGSDAIAGVVNFILKRDDHGFMATGQVGITPYGDGQTSQIGVNLGMPLPFINKGYLNMTAEVDTQGRTVRAGYYINPGVFSCPAYAATHPVYAAAINWNNGTNPHACIRYPTGQPSNKGFKSIVNAGIDVTDNSELYTFANFAVHDGYAIGSYRYPGPPQQVNGPTVRLEDGSPFSFSDMFPAGWVPHFGAQVTDWSDVAGYRGHWDFADGQKLNYDFSGRFGYDRIAYHVDNTVNPSLGPTTPTHFTPYADEATEKSLNADFSYILPTSFTATPLTLAFGAEYMHRTYRILGGNAMGDPASLVAGPYAFSDPYDFCNGTVPTARGAALPVTAGLNCANPKDPVYQLLPAGSNSITGLPDISTGIWTDSNTSFYAEADTNIVENWEVDIAARAENYASFGTNTSAKIATYLKINDWLALRGSAGTGFHAPPPGMLNQTNIQLTTVNGQNVQSGLFPAYNPVAAFLGAKPLDPEKAVNFSAGVTTTPFENFTLTLDAYWIRMFGQIYSVSPIAVTPAIAAQITAAGIPGASAISTVFFFQNAFDSNTQGFDLVATYNMPWEDTLWGMDQATKLTATFNMNRYVISHLIIPNLFTPASKFNFEHNSPKWRSVITLNHDFGPFEATVRANLYGTYEIVTTNNLLHQKYPFMTPMIDVEGSYQMTDNFKVALGIQNVFNNYPDVNVINNTSGSMYSDQGIPWQGGYYYLRLQYSE